MSKINWTNLVNQGRAKAIGIPWSKREREALKDGLSPDDVRNGFLSKEEKKRAKNVDERAMEDLKKEAEELGIEYFDEVSRGDLILEIDKIKKRMKKDLEDMTRAELLKHAKKVGVDIERTMTKEDLKREINKVEEK